MYSYQLQLENNVLRVGFNRVISAQGDRLVKDAFEQLKMMIDSGELSGGSLLKIDGPQSVPVAYVLSHKLAHLYEAVAVLDPKIGRKGYKTYIVTAVHGSSKHKVGDIIETEEPQPQRSKIKVVLCGPPQSGKSCLREGLKRAILSKLGAPYPYVITACPDGEGSHYQATYAKDESSAKDIKQMNKAEFTPQFAQEAAKWVRSANQLINIIDVGGKISEENRQIMQPATHAVILAGDESKFAEWEDFCHPLDLKVVAKIHSQLNAEEDTVSLASNWQEDTIEHLEKAPLLNGTVHNLQRGEDVATRPMIQALAEVLVHLTNC